MTTEKSDIDVVLDWVCFKPFERSIDFTHFDNSEGGHEFEIMLHGEGNELFHAFADSREEAFRAAREWIERQG